MVRIKTVLDIFCALIFFTALTVNITHLDSVIIVGSLFITLFILYLNYRQNRKIQIPRWILNAAGLAFVVFYLFTIRINDPIPQLLELIVVLFIIKWLEREKTRDYLQILTLNLFLLVGYALYTFKLSFLLVLLICFLMGTSCLILLTIYDENSPDKAIDLKIVQYNLTLSAVLLIFSLPLTTILFIILPRTDFPILSFLNKSSSGRSGFSDTVRLGDVSRIQEDESVVFRARLSPTPKNTKLYWRGIVFDFFDGTKWSLKNYNFRPFSPKSYRSRKIILQKIVLEPYGEPYLFCLDFPINISIKDKKALFEQEKLLFLLDTPVINRLYYECLSLKSKMFVKEPPKNLDIYLQLPGKLPNRLQNVVKNLRKPGDPERTIKNFMRWLNTSFIYSLSELPVSDSPLEEFLFGSRKGNCEYFASALGVMLRMAGIPSRLVAGYRGGYFQPVGNYFIVLQKNAHVWVEAYIANKGWKRLDATPANLPSGKGKNLETMSFLFRLRLYLDVVNYYWNQMVILYDLEKQIRILKNLQTGVKQLTELSLKIGQWSNLKLAEKIDINKILLILLAICTPIVVFIIVKLVSNSPEVRLYRRFLRQIEILGIERKNPSETLGELKLKAEKQLSFELSEKISAFIELYSQCLYGHEGFTPENIRKLREIIKEIKEHSGAYGRILD